MSGESNERNGTFSCLLNSIIKMETAYTLLTYVHILLVKVSEEVWSCHMDTRVVDQFIQVAMVAAGFTSPSSSSY